MKFGLLKYNLKHSSLIIMSNNHMNDLHDALKKIFESAPKNFSEFMKQTDMIVITGNKEEDKACAKRYLETCIMSFILLRTLDDENEIIIEASDDYDSVDVLSGATFPNDCGVSKRDDHTVYLASRIRLNRTEAEEVIMNMLKKFNPTVIRETIYKTSMRITFKLS